MPGHFRRGSCRLSGSWQPPPRNGRTPPCNRPHRVQAAPQTVPQATQIQVQRTSLSRLRAPRRTCPPPPAQTHASSGKVRQRDCPMIRGGTESPTLSLNAQVPQFARDAPLCAKTAIWRHSRHGARPCTSSRLQARAVPRQDRWKQPEARLARRQERHRTLRMPQTRLKRGTGDCRSRNPILRG